MFEADEVDKQYVTFLKTLFYYNTSFQLKNP